MHLKIPYNVLQADPRSAIVQGILPVMSSQLRFKSRVFYIVTQNRKRITATFATRHLNRCRNTEASPKLHVIYAYQFAHSVNKNVDS